MPVIWRSTVGDEPANIADEVRLALRLIFAAHLRQRYEAAAKRGETLPLRRPFLNHRPRSRLILAPHRLQRRSARNRPPPAPVLLV